MDIENDNLEVAPNSEESPTGAVHKADPRPLPVPPAPNAVDPKERAEKASPKGKRGRPPGSKTGAKKSPPPKTGENKVPTDQTTPKTEFSLPSGSLSLLFSSIFGVVSIRAGEHWKLSADESRVLEEAALPLLEKYGGQIVGEYGAEIGFGLAVFGIIFPRLRHDPNSRKEGAGKNNPGESSAIHELSRIGATES